MALEYCGIGLKSAKDAWSWGWNIYGQLGDNTRTNKSSPVAVAGGRSFDEIAKGVSHVLARDKSTGLVYAWGYNNIGQLGDNTRTSKSSPVAVAGGRSFDEISAGNGFSVARDKSTGLVYAWGSNNFGQLGDNTITSKSSPVAVAGGRSFDEISGGDTHALARDASTGLVYAWGYNSSGQLGDNTKTSRSSPIAVAGGRSFDEISGGQSSSLARDASTGLVYAWGDNGSGQIGDNTKTGKSSPIAVAGGRSFDEISAGYAFVLARDASTGLVYAWGDNSSGQLGDNTITGKSSPVAVAGGRSFDEISAGNGFCLARDKSTGLVYGWGANWAGQLGDNSLTGKSSPVVVAGNISFAALRRFPAVGVVRALVGAVGGASLTPDVSVSVGRGMLASVAGSSSASDVAAKIVRGLVALLGAASGTSGAQVAIARRMVSNVEGISVVGDVCILVARVVAAAISGSSVSGEILALMCRALVAGIIVESLTSSVSSSTGGGLTMEEHAEVMKIAGIESLLQEVALKLVEIYELYGLDGSKPLVVTRVSRDAGAIHQDIETVGGTVRVVRS